ncbi:MAG: DUF4097 domain-containing protein [Lachnospiraceae bacterium]|nr:DUF4097 domain-containing protein [Lachnospiraceae bacterium]MCM1241005.1 DUF4097 domain-containing protein [Lachnospiraceae bacterium]MCM1303541.1 DUF4097 domain-containing protein [Butyrivibrio sp.]MCM1343265.1 DUF4097 domain-containing protein [Muribaculaceae bacterium]MCM1409297.1 DUF4097 domain-containing protein [Lachnospiraceae bacterium]
MKRLKISLIAALSVVIIGLCGILAYGVAGGDAFGNDMRQSYRNAQLVLEEEIPAGGIDSISILYGMNDNDIYLYESEKDTIIVREYGSLEMSEKELSTIKVNGNRLEVRGARRSDSSSGFHLFYSGGFYNRHYAEVYLPRSYQGELLLETSSGEIASEMDIVLGKDCSVSSSSGDISFSSITADNVSVDTASGYVKMENINTNEGSSAGEISVRTSSGDVKLEELTGSTDIECSSGNVTVETIMGDAQVRTSSGNVDIKSLTGEMKTESSSGYLSIGTLTGNAQFKTTSGDIEVRHLDGDVQAMTASGNVQIPEGSGDRAISTSSGDIMAEGTEGSFQISTQSGYVRIGLEKGEGRIETSSGDVQLNLTELTGMLNVDCSSGYVDIRLADENEFEFTASTSSGDIVTFFDKNLIFSSRRNHAQGTYGANEQGNRIEIQTTSGDVRISEY